MPIQFILKFTRAQVEWPVGELALQYQGSKDKKIKTCVLTEMDVGFRFIPNPKIMNSPK